MNTLQGWIYSLADTMVVWRDLAILGLAGLVIACIWVYVSALGE